MIGLLHLVGFGGAIGAVARHLVGEWLPGYRFPIATVAVNVGGSFLLGLLTFADVGDQVLLFFGVGACGAFTTYSTFSVETVQLWERGERLRAAVYAIGTFLACAIAVGFALGLVTLV